MRFRPLMSIRFTTAALQEIGRTPRGTRVTFPILGGRFDGERLHGKVLAGGDDWATTREDGVMELDLRVTLETDDGALVHMTFDGIRAGDYLRTLPRFATAHPRYAFLNKLLAAGVGEITPDGPVHHIEELL